MEKIQRALFFRRLDRKKEHFPFNGQIELSYRCNLNCIHCYCKGLEDKEKELTTGQWKRILNILQVEGCVRLCLTGGEPLIRNDFLEIYSYAKAKGFIITIFTNGQALTREIINYLVKSPPFSIEITLNGITKNTYESITQVPGSLEKLMRVIKILKEKKVPFKLKANSLKQNMHELGRIKAFADKLFPDLPKNKFLFGYGNFIYPRLNCDTTPTNYRLSFEESQELRRQDPDIWREHQRRLRSKLPDLGRERSFLYRCNAWMKEFFIDPYGKLRFCVFSDKFSADLKTTPFGEGFYNIFPRLLNQKFKTGSKCKNCRLRPICENCPAAAYLETGDEEAPVAYFCEFTKAMYREMKKSRKS